MRFADVPWRTRITTVRLGGDTNRRDTYRVIRPARPLTHAVLFDDAWSFEMTVDKRTAVMLATAWALAARSPNSIVYLPMRGAGATEYEHDGQRLDLVFLHHRLGFPPARWKEVRARLGAGAPHTVTVPAGSLPGIETAEHRRALHRGFRDHLLYEVAADTLFVTGSRSAYDRQAEDIREFVEQGPAELARNPGAHVCAEILLGRLWSRQRRNPPVYLHVHYRTAIPAK